MCMTGQMHFSDKLSKLSVLFPVLGLTVYQLAHQGACAEQSGRLSISLSLLCWRLQDAKNPNDGHVPHIHHERKRGGSRGRDHLTIWPAQAYEPSPGEPCPFER